MRLVKRVAGVLLIAAGMYFTAHPGSGDLLEIIACAAGMVFGFILLVPEAFDDSGS